MLNTAPLLLIDDDAGDTELALAALELAAPGLPVVTHRDGASALAWLHERARAGGAPPFAVLLDWKMAGMGGRDVLRALRASPLPRVPVVVFSTSAEEGDRRLALALGADGFTRKPAAFADLVETLGDLVGAWSGLHRPRSAS